uniref:uncharacterized protein plekhn1 n=1 Tax=Pristiophorus japonicus TaxID=55135 RepID=UPI00398E3BDE
MGSNFSCISKSLNQSRKRRKRSRARSLSLREQVQQQIVDKSRNEPATDQNEDYVSSQAQTRSVKEAKRNDKADIENRLRYNPIMEWEQSGMKLEDLGRMVHGSKVKISRQPSKDINNRCLALFQNHLLILSDDFRGFTYQGMLPLAGITVHNMESSSNSEQSCAFQITGPLLHPFTVYCSTECAVKEWLYYLNKQRQMNSKIVDTPRVQTCRELNRNSPGQITTNVDLRTFILNQPIHGGERSRINSLGGIIWITEAKLQHLPFQDQHDRLLILFPTTLLILSVEDHALHYKGELPLNAITISEQEESDSDSSTLLIEGKMINQIVVSSQNSTAHQKLIHYLSSAGVTVQKASTINDYKHSPRCRDQVADRRDPSLESHRRGNSPTTVYGIFTFPQKPVEMISASESLPALVTEDVAGQLDSADYAEPYTPPPSWFPAPAMPLRLTSMVTGQDPSIKCQQSNSGTTGSNMARLSPTTLQSGNPASSCCSPSGECLNNCLSPTYAEPYMPFQLQPTTSAKLLWLREPVTRHNSSSFPDRRGDQQVPLRKSLPLSQPPVKSNCVLGKDSCSFAPGHLDIPLAPVYALPFAATKKQLAPPTDLVSKPNDSLTRYQWSNTQLLAQERLPRPSLPSSSMSGHSSCSCVDGKPLTDPLSPTYAEPYLPLRLQPAPPVDCFWMREAVSRRGSADFPVHCSKDDSSEYYTIIQLLDSYQEGKNISWYSDDSRYSITSSEHTYAELESTQDDSDYEFWDFNFKHQVIPHLSPPTLRKLRLRNGGVDSRLQGKVHRWS